VALGKFGPEAKEAVPALTHIAIQEEELTGVALQALASIGPSSKKAVPALLNHLRTMQPDRRDELVAGLFRIAPADEPGLPKAARDILAEGCSGVQLLRYAGSPAAPFLIEATTDVRVEVRREALEALGCIRAEAKSVLPALQRALCDADEIVRQDALFALGS